VFYNPSNNGFDWPLWEGYRSTPLGARIAVFQPRIKELENGKDIRNFGVVRVAHSGRPRTFTLRNIGTKRLKGIKIRKFGRNPKDFVVSGLGERVLMPGESTTFQVTFEPNHDGKRKATLQIRSNDPDNDPFKVRMKGKALEFNCW
jgi:hypothetical protein